MQWHNNNKQTHFQYIFYTHMEKHLSSQRGGKRRKNFDIASETRVKRAKSRRSATQTDATPIAGITKKGRLSSCPRERKVGTTDKLLSLEFRAGSKIFRIKPPPQREGAGKNTGISDPKLLFNSIREIYSSLPFFI
jgi:hypothetical protein